MGETLTVKKVANNNLEKSNVSDQHLLGSVTFIKRGWFNKEAFKCEGEISSYDPKLASHKVVYNVFGNWNNSVYL